MYCMYALVQVMIFTGHTDVKPMQCKLHVTSLLVHMHSTSFRWKSGVLSPPTIWCVTLIQRSVESVNIHNSAVILHSHGCTNSIPYSTYYKPMGDLSYISSEQGGGLIIHHGLIMRITIYKRPTPIQELWAEDGGGLIIHHGLIIRTIRYTYSFVERIIIPRECMNF